MDIITPKNAVLFFSSSHGNGHHPIFLGVPLNQGAQQYTLSWRRQAKLPLSQGPAVRALRSKCKSSERSPWVGTGGSPGQEVSI